MSSEEMKNLTETLKMISEMIKTKPDEWLPLYAALGGAIAGAIASFFPTFLIERYREKKLSSSLLASLLAEISALLQIIEHRKYHKSIKEVIEYLKSQPPGTTHSYTVEVPTHYSRIFQENCNSIGRIDKFYSERIVIFHQLIDAVVQDVKPAGVISKGAKLDVFVETEQILSRALKIGKELL